MVSVSLACVLERNVIPSIALMKTHLYRRFGFCGLSSCPLHLELQVKCMLCDRIFDHPVGVFGRRSAYTLSGVSFSSLVPDFGMSEFLTVTFILPGSLITNVYSSSLSTVDPSASMLGGLFCTDCLPVSFWQGKVELIHLSSMVLCPQLQFWQDVTHPVDR